MPNTAPTVKIMQPPCASSLPARYLATPLGALFTRPTLWVALRRFLSFYLFLTSHENCVYANATAMSIYKHNCVKRVLRGRDYNVIGCHLTGEKYSHDVIVSGANWLISDTRIVFMKIFPFIKINIVYVNLHTIKHLRNKYYFP